MKNFDEKYWIEKVGHTTYGFCFNVFNRPIPLFECDRIGYVPTDNGYSYPINQLVSDKMTAYGYRHPDYDFIGYKIK